MEVRAEHPLKAWLPIDVTNAGMEIDSSLVALLKADAPIFMT